MPSTTDEAEATAIDLDCTRYKSASMSHAPQGAYFRCSCGPLTPLDLTNLEEAARLNRRIRLLFVGGHVLLSDVEIERIESNWVRVKGRVITSALPPQPV